MNYFDRNRAKTLCAATLTVGMAVSSAWADDLTIGFITHAQGNPYLEQIIDGGKAATADLKLILNAQRSAGASPENQLKLAQGLVNAGAAGIATSAPGDAMAKGINDIADSGVPVVQFDIPSPAIKATYIGEKSVEGGRVLGKAIVDKLGGVSATGKVIIGICFPGGPGLIKRNQGVMESLAAAPGLNVLGPFDVKVSAVDNYNHWEQLYAANPDAVAMIGLCEPDLASLGKLNAAHGDKFVAGGYDLSEANLAAIRGGHAHAAIGTSPFVKGYLAVVLLEQAIKAKRPTPEGGFYDSGIQLVTTNGATMGHGLPDLTLDKLIALSKDPAATAEFYKPWSTSVLAADTPPGLLSIAAESE